MLDLFKNWISLILSIGILFTIIRMVIPNSNMKKYTYSLIGVVTIIVLISPIVSLVKDFRVDNVKKIFLNATNESYFSNINYTNISNYEDVNKNNVKENFRKNVEEDIKNKLRKNVENVDEVKIKITDTYDIEEVYIVVYGDTSFDIVSFISKEYDIKKENIKIKKGG